MRIRWLAAVMTVLLGAVPASAGSPLVLAAASLEEAMTAAARAWTAQGHAPPRLSFAASSTLARQIDAGAPADLFLSADEGWMDDVQAHGRVRAGTRADLLSNRLVLVRPATGGRDVAIGPRLPLAALLGRSGRLAMADPDSVPAGRYGKAALVSLGLWPSVRDRIAPGDSVRAALAYVERGQTPYGIVYATDAKASSAVRVAGLFPPASHPRILYPIARLVAGRSPDADAFERFLTSPRGRAIFARYGFLPPR